MAKQELISAMKTLQLTVHSAFVPFSKSRNKDEKHPSLNWQVTLKKNDYNVLTTDYTAGSAHTPSYKQGDRRVMTNKRVRDECESGLDPYRKPINPDSCDVICSLISDTEVLNYGSFEDWAQSFGYDSDSRQAEKIYRACLDIALKLRNSLGDRGLQALQEASQDY